MSDRSVIDLDLGDPEQLAEALMLGAISPIEATTAQIQRLGAEFCDVLGKLRAAGDAAQVRVLEHEAAVDVERREVQMLRRVNLELRRLIMSGRIREPLCPGGGPPSTEAVELLTASAHMIVDGSPESMFALMVSGLASLCLTAVDPIGAFDDAIDLMMSEGRERVLKLATAAQAQQARGPQVLS